MWVFLTVDTTLKKRKTLNNSGYTINESSTLGNSALYYSGTYCQTCCHSLKTFTQTCNLILVWPPNNNTSKTAVARCKDFFGSSRGNHNYSGGVKYKLEDKFHFHSF